MMDLHGIGRVFPMHEIHPRKINIEPENDDLEDDFPDGNGPFLGDMIVFWGVVDFLLGSI